MHLIHKIFDKATWSGYWQLQPDVEQWIDRETGLPCLIVRGDDGTLFGFVGVDRTNASYGVTLGAKTLDYALFGDGMKFAGRFTPEPITTAKCVHDGPDTAEPIWWFGFSYDPRLTGADKGKFVGLPAGEAECRELACWLSRYPFG